MKQLIINLNFKYDDGTFLATYPLKTHIPDNLTEEQEILFIQNTINNIEEMQKEIENNSKKVFKEIINKEKICQK